MNVKNQELARIFERIADALELKGETGFRVLAYRKAARVLAELTEDIIQLNRENRLTSIPGIGVGIAQKINEYLSTGKMKKLEEAISGIEPGLFALLEIPGLGPKTVKLLSDKLNVKNINDLKRVISNGSAAQLPGMGEKKVENIRKGLENLEHSGERMYLNEAFELAELIIKHMKQDPAVNEITAAGSLRRGRETIGDIDILASGTNPYQIINRFLTFPLIHQVLSAGKTKASIVISGANGMRQIDLRVVRPEIFGAALQYFTGSKDHNIALRARAQKMGLKISEYGVFKKERRIAGRTEKEVYQAIGLPFIEPELRENRGEIEAAEQNKLPKLVRLEDIKADLHIHTNASDGSSSLEEIVNASQQMGYTHIAIAEHSVSAGYAGGLSAEELLRRCDEIDRWNEKVKGFRILKSAEVDITPNGKLDYSDRILARLDLVIASIHQAFNREATKRICSALAHPLVHIVAHPTGRLIGKRMGYDIDMEKVIECASENHKILEINSYYERLDLNDIWSRKAKEGGVLLAINTDAHSVSDLKWMRFGVITARRAWITKKDVVNCLALSKLLELLNGITSNSR